MTECSSTRGKWSTLGKPPNRCPVCKQDMPYDRGALRSDWSMKNHDESKVYRGGEPFTLDGVAFKLRKKAA